jgi:hypothetical protein
MMAEEKDKRVAGPPEEPVASPHEPPAGEPPVRRPEPGEAVPPAAQQPPAQQPPAPQPPVQQASMQQPPPAGPPPVAPPPVGPVPPAGGLPRRSGDWARRKPVQLLAAGVSGAIIGGGAVAVIDLLDDHEDRRQYVMIDRRGQDPFGPGLKRWNGPGWDGRYPPRWSEPRQRPTMPMPLPGTPEPAPTEPSPTPRS